MIFKKLNSKRFKQMLFLFLFFFDIPSYTFLNILLREFIFFMVSKKKTEGLTIDTWFELVLHGVVFFLFSIHFDEAISSRFDYAGDFNQSEYDQFLELSGINSRNDPFLKHQRGN